MKIKTLLLSMACVAAMAVGGADVAQAHPHHHIRHHHAHVHRHHVKHHLVRAEVPAEKKEGLASLFSFHTRPGSNAIVSEARRYIGDGPVFGRRNLWCARFMNFVLEKTGFKTTHSDMAASFYHYGHRISGPRVGAIAVMGRRGGGHVGVVSGITPNGDPILISGNHDNRVKEAVYPRRRIEAYVVPN